MICDYLLLNCITAKKFQFNDNKNDLHHEKEHKKLHITHLNSFFFILRIVFELYVVKTPIFKLVPSFYCTILVQSSHLKQKYLETYLKNKKNCLNVLYVVFCALSHDASRFFFVIVEFKISNFFAVIQFNRR